MGEFFHDPSNNRFVLRLPDSRGDCLIEYDEVTKDTLRMYHTETPPSEQGRGLAGILTKQTFDMCVEQNLKIVPTCPYLSAYVKKHPEYNSIVAK